MAHIAIWTSPCALVNACQMLHLTSATGNRAASCKQESRAAQILRAHALDLDQTDLISNDEHVWIIECSRPSNLCEAV